MTLGTAPDISSARLGFYTQSFARYASEFTWDKLPADVQQQARAIVLDTLGAILAASSPRYQAGTILGGFVERSGGTPESSLIGRGVKSSIVNAALFNGTLGYYCDVEAHHPGAIMHAAAIVVPTSLAVCEARGLSGKALLAAVVLGVDAACRVSYAIDPNALYQRGFHPTAVCGAFGAAAAVGNLLGLDAARQADAFGLAASQASGLLAWSSDHTEQSRPFNPGIAARNGATAALLAEAGFGAPLNILDPAMKYNVFRAWSTEPRPDELLDKLHERYFIQELAIKLYSCCAFLHPGLDGIMSLLEDGEVTADEIESIVLRFSHSGRSIIDNNELKSHCAQYILPIGLHNREIVIDDILQDRRDPRVAALSERTQVIGDDDLERLYPDRYSSIVELTRRDGTAASRRVDWPKGYPQNPVTQTEIEQKFLRLAGTVVDGPDAERIVEMVAVLDRMASIDPLVALLVSTHTR
jgi:2-methylcitrate dehydratase PrpD